MSLTSLTFDPEKHEYRIDGEVVPSVTQILTKAGMTDLTFCTEHGLNLGTAIHAAIHLHVTGKLDMDSLDPQVQPYYQQWLNFLNDTNFRVIQTEQPVYHTGLMYAGTLDVRGELNGLQIVMDFKSNSKPRAVQAQLGGYSLAVRSHLFQVDVVACLVLKRDKYRLATFDRLLAEAEFMRAYNMAQESRDQWPSFLG